MTKNIHMLTGSILLVMIACLLHCLQGPWEYQPETPQVFRGITANAYIVNNEPLREICFERLTPLDEGYTPSFAFYDSFYVEVTGNGGGGLRTVQLTPQDGSPMCFEGPDDFVGIAGERYELKAVFFWDSAGTSVRSELNGSTVIPQTWSIARTARVNSAALMSELPDSLPVGPGFGVFTNGLPSAVREELIVIFGPELLPIANDTTALQKWLTENAVRLNTTIDSLLKSNAESGMYREMDTVQYLGGALNLTSHLFDATYSPDVKGVLISHRFSENGRHAFTRFDEIAATFRELDAAYFHFVGNLRRLLFYSQVKDESFSIFDSIPVSNGFLKGGKNTLYFYACDAQHSQFVETYIQRHSDSRVRYYSTVTGGQGFFTGLHADSFSLYVTIPDAVQSYSVFEARAASCAENEWGTKECREFEPSYCEQVLYNDKQYAFDHPEIIEEPENRNDCLAEAVARGLVKGRDMRYLRDSILINGTTIRWNERKADGTTQILTRVFTEEELQRAEASGILRFCIRTDFQADICLELVSIYQCGPAGNDTLEALYTYCVDNKWESTPCRQVMIRYCQKSSAASPVLCDRARQLVAENRWDTLCR